MISIPRQQGLLQPVAAPAVCAPPAGAIVLEAEHFAAMNYGWEVKHDPHAGNSCVIISKEGVANNQAQQQGFGDFYNIGNNRTRSELYYSFNLPNAGDWFIQARMMTSGTHCSNQVTVFLDGTQIGNFGSNDLVPFNWVWNPPQRLTLASGEHTLRIYPWEDGLQFDQILLSPAPVEGSSILASTLDNRTHGKQTLFVIHDLLTCILGPQPLPALTVWLRRTAEATGTAHLSTEIELPGRNMTLLSRTFSLGTLKPLSAIPVDLSTVPVATLPRREYLLKTILRVDKRVVCITTTALLKPLRWRVLGMLPFMDGNVPFAADGWAEQNSYTLGTTTCTWAPFRNEWYDHFGVMDFGVMFANNSLHAPEQKTLYAQTHFRVPSSGVYLFKVLADDQMTLWLDGAVVAEKTLFWPVTRGALRVTARLSAGVHRLQFRLNQKTDRWQAGVQIRSVDDQIIALVGEE
jgi:hypothetical protein